MSLTPKQKAYILKNKQKSVKALSRDLNVPVEDIEEVLSSQSSQLSESKKRLFTSILFLIPIFFFLLLELLLRGFDYKGNLDLFFEPEELGGFYTFPNPNFAARYFFTTSVIPNPSRDSFLSYKPENGYRVFIMGGSSAAGFPYVNNARFSKKLHFFLQDILPNRTVEVVNIGISAVNSYTLYDQIDEVIEHKPDLILIFTGHNEFYGALGAGSSESLGYFPAFIRFYLKIQRLKTFLLLRDFYVKLTLLFAEPPQTSSTLMSRVVKEQEIPLDSDIYNLGKIQFESNLNAILAKFKKHDIPVVIGSLASNIRDHEPFSSIKTENYPAAIEQFHKAQSELHNGNLINAKSLFVQAKDLDALRFRAASEFNDIIKTYTQKNQAYFVPVDSLLSLKAKFGIIGNDLMLEHLHPNITGYLEIGSIFANYLLNSNLLPNADLSAVKAFNYYDNNISISEFDIQIGYHKIRRLMHAWPFVPLVKSITPLPYHSVSFADSMAWRVVTHGDTWEKAKVSVAQNYHANGEIEKAALEYQGIAVDIPYNNSAPELAGKLFLQIGDSERAEPLLKQAYSIEKTAFSAKMLGSIAVQKEEYEKGIQLLKEALSLNNNDLQAKYNLSGALALNGEPDLAIELAREIYHIKPDYPGLTVWIKQLESVLKQTNTQ